MAQQRWIPLESNPAVLNKYIGALGAKGNWQFTDVYGLDDELLMMVPSPVIAVMLLYPLTDKAKSVEIGTPASEVPKSLYFMRQSIGNACGTVALVHALANNEEHITFDAEKHFRKFLDSTKDMSPEERAKHLEGDKGMSMAHEDSANEGDTQAPSPDVSVTQHFVAFVLQNGSLYEMDGRKEAPICHGKTTADCFLKDTVAVVKKFMERDPEEISFTLMALAASQ
ncbi:ubiquitin carboxyl-terminal hydrolase-like [Babylonia areolata]|uniref:ubiquitin carboxyl-terminal hydrolase-like n=1 Tax=Babylonia areolata TaxID=304850 RepID=UPI003FD41798